MALPPSFFFGAWRYRYYLRSAIYKEFRTRFLRSQLGALWAILNPLALVAIYAFILSGVLSARLPGLDGPFVFAAYLSAGMLAWTLFSDILLRGTRLFIDNAEIIRKVVFPKINLPIIALGVALLDNLLLLACIVLLLGLLGHWPGLQVVWLPLLLIINAGLAIGFGLIVGTLNVYLRDLTHLVPILLQFGFWFTPIVYAVEMLPPALRPWLLLNPMVPLVTAYQDVLVFNRAPELTMVLLSATLALVVLSCALLLFRRANYQIVDLL